MLLFEITAAASSKVALVIVLTPHFVNNTTFSARYLTLSFPVLCLEILINEEGGGRKEEIQLYFKTIGSGGFLFNWVLFLHHLW